MNEPTEQQEPKQEPDAPTLFDQKPGVDWLLAFLVGWAEQGLTMGVTVTVEGTVITGEIIGGREYFQAIASIMRQANYQGTSQEQNFGTVVGDAIEGFKQIYPEKQPEDYVAQPGYLHLKNAKFLLGDKLTTKGAPWRIDLAKISAFTFGTLTTS
ncbi:hypothetical protein HU675_0035160 [Bradyrhizobium septentrionale]|uniref:hypothetical protein n=1 Tax=Bradyrhizobium septentrionale TaxID=1404411 RepID=UPI00159683C6|nr:hypothetical protein [Bradyrhizobium septentrionale]UGY23157.1 hypothetical protein HU675_0035160 [Bradyrhizobium septentrionale]